MRPQHDVWTISALWTVMQHGDVVGHWPSALVCMRPVPRAATLEIDVALRTVVVVRGLAIGRSGVSDRFQG